MLTDLANLLFQNPFLDILGVVYFFLTFGNSDKRDLYFNNVWKLLTEPTQLDKYPAQWFESYELNVREWFLNGPIPGIINWLGNKIKEQLVDWKKITGWLLVGFFLLAFAVADAIIINSMAELMGFPVTIPLPSFFYDYGLAITIGAFVSLLASSFVLFEILGKSEYSEFNKYEGVMRSIILWGSWLVLGSSLLVVMFFALKAFSVGSNLPDWLMTFFDETARFGGNVMVRFNAFVLTWIVFLEAIKSIYSIAMILLIPAIIIMGLVWAIVAIPVILGRVFIDLFYRIILWVVWTLSFLIIAPMDKILSLPDIIKNWQGKKAS